MPHRPLAVMAAVAISLPLAACSDSSSSAPPSPAPTSASSGGPSPSASATSRGPVSVQPVSVPGYRTVKAPAATQQSLAALVQDSGGKLTEAAAYLVSRKGQTVGLLELFAISPEVSNDPMTRQLVQNGVGKKGGLNPRTRVIGGYTVRSSSEPSGQDLHAWSDGYLIGSLASADDPAAAETYLRAYLTAG